MGYVKFIPNLLMNQVFTVLGIALMFMLGIDFIKYYLFKKFNV